MDANFRVNEIFTDEDTYDVIAKCYDIIYDEEFEKFLGNPNEFSGKENASNLLKDSNYEIPDDIRADIEDIFSVTEFDAENEYNTGYQFYDFDDDEDLDDDFDDEKALALLGRGKKESFNLREALNQIDIDTYNKYDLLNLYESCNLNENEKRALANIVYDQEDASVIYDTLNNRYITGEEIGMPEKAKDGVIHEDVDTINGRVMEFPNGEYFYVNKTGNTLSIGSATNNGFIPEYEIDYDEDLSLDMNLQNLYDYALESNPQLMDESNELEKSKVDDYSGDDMNESKSLKESFPRNIDLDQVVMQVANLVDDKALGDDWIEVFPTRDASPSAAGEYFIPLEITGPDDVTKKATFRTRNGRVEVAFLNGSEAMCDSAESIARFIAGEFGLNIGAEGYTTTKLIKESDEETPYTKEEVETDLKSITHNFTDKEGDLKCGFEEEKNFAVEILKQHYKVVETSGDDRRSGTWYHISFAEPIIKESITHSPLSTAGPIPYAVKLLYQMDRFVMDVYDNEGWLMNGVPDGEFEETTPDEAMQNYTEHAWLIEDADSPDGINWGDFNDFIDTFKRVTKSRDYDQEERNEIIDEANTLVREYAKYKD